MEPKYAENIIVGVKDSKGFQWYLTDRNKWILDINKYANDVEKCGKKFDMPFALKIRKNVDVIDNDNIVEYLIGLQENKISITELRELKNSGKYEENEMLPTLYIDFVRKVFYSYFQEPIYPEKYVPDGWKGEFKKFYNLIPLEMNYWE